MSPNKLFSSPEQKALLESRNALALFDEVKLIYEDSRASGKLLLTPIIIRHFQGLAVKDIYSCAGSYRVPSLNVVIQGSEHKLPPAMDVPVLMQEMCEYVNRKTARSPVHFAAYVLWRINWIHPFAGGNGRTARAASYLALCAKLGFWLPGTKTIAQLIAESRKPYYDALKAADIAFGQGNIDLQEMEKMISNLLATQLLEIHEQAIGSQDPPKSE